MTPETSPFDPAIAELENRIRGMQIALDTLKQLRAQTDGGTPASASAATRPGETEVQHDSFFGMTIADAAKKYLGMVKHTKSTADIATALEAGGLKHASKDFHTTLRTTIGPKEEFLRVPNGEWGLTEWYPGIGRGKKPKPEKPAKAKPSAKKGARISGSSDGSTRKERILQTMGTDSAKDWTAGEIAKMSSDKRRHIQAMLWGMVKAGEVVKAERGYRLHKAKAA